MLIVEFSRNRFTHEAIKKKVEKRSRRMTSPRPVIISCDGHATGRAEDYVPYVERGYREKYAEFMAELERREAAQARAREADRSLFSKEGSEAFEAETGDARDGEWNSSVRSDVLEREGVVAEVLFPNGRVPFGGFGESAEHELRGVGNRAYDRWLLRFCERSSGPPRCPRHADGARSGSHGWLKSGGRPRRE